MKFLYQLEYCIIPEWSEYYIDYQNLKMYLKKFFPNPNKQSQNKTISNFDLGLNKLEVLSTDNPNNEGDSSVNLIDNISISQLNTTEIRNNLNEFISLFQRQINKIVSFLSKKQEELENEYASMQKKFNDANYKTSLERDRVHERDEMGYASSWKRALSNIYNLTSWLHSYYSINTIGLKKIIKSANKSISYYLSNSNISFQLEQIVNSSLINEKGTPIVCLRKKIQLIYAKEFNKNNMKKAINELDTGLKSKRTKHTTLIAYYSGIISTCLLMYIFIALSSKYDEKKSMIPFFPVFNFTFIIIELILGLGLNLLVLRKYRINFIYIFEVEPKNRLGHYEIFQLGLCLLSIWSIFLLITKVTLTFNLFNGNYYYFALSNLLIIFVLFIFPLHCSYLEFRKGIFLTLVRNLFPFTKNSVRFRDFVFGDIVTSINKPLASLILSLCLFSCEQCKEENIRSSYCNRNTVACLFVLFYPFFIRFTQCLNRYIYTREAWPHLGNCLKYIGGMSNAIFGWIYANNSSYLRSHILIGMIATSYMTFWDFYMDWNLLRFKAKYLLLRDNIVYPKTYYYAAMVSNIILRYLWLSNFIDKRYLFGINDEVRNFILAILEAYRRIQWAIFRVENENTNNPEKYREILEIPQLPYD